MKLILSIIGFIFVVISLVLALTNYGKTIDNTYDKCNICIKSGISYNCDCIKIIKYKETFTPLFLFFNITGIALCLIPILIKGDKNEK